MRPFACTRWVVGALLIGSVPCLPAQQVTAGAPPTQEITMGVTLQQAIALASSNEPMLAAARAERGASALERTNARAALLPTAVYHNQAIYTQANGIPTSRIGQTANAPSPIFIANNAVREYASQGVFSETLGLGQVAAIRLADATAARAEAELEVARRGLVATLVTLFYGVGGADEKVEIAVRAMAEAKHFVDITGKREAAREAAHADVLKAQLTEQQRERELAEAQLGRVRARTELGVLLYPNPSVAFTLAPDPVPAKLPELADVEVLARSHNPEIESALATLRGSEAETAGARAALLPELALNVTYGIDATNFGVNGPDGIHNLGYSLSAGLDIPVWNWLSTERSVKAARLREGAAKVALTSTQRRLMADLSEFYAEARAAEAQIGSLDASVAGARESLRLTNLRYVDGESTVLEVVDAETTLTASELAQVDGRLRYRLALAQLETLTGRM